MHDLVCLDWRSSRALSVYDEVQKITVRAFLLKNVIVNSEIILWRN